MALDVAILVGSLRKESFTRKLAKAIAAMGGDKIAFRFVEIGALALYNADLETEAPPREWVKFRDEVRSAQAVLFATPEYNRSVPGVLKNAIDVGSRPPGKSVFQHKPAAVVSVTNGALGAFGANHHLRQSLVFLDMPALQQPEIYIGRIATLLDEQGGIANADVKKLLASFVDAFAAWIEANKP
jgi:chromate reductase, NAD(P)H dehydrogenase (quinone)